MEEGEKAVGGMGSARGCGIREKSRSASRCGVPALDACSSVRSFAAQKPGERRSEHSDFGSSFAQDEVARGYPFAAPSLDSALHLLRGRTSSAERSSKSGREEQLPLLLLALQLSKRAASGSSTAPGTMPPLKEDDSETVHPPKARHAA